MLAKYRKYFPDIKLFTIEQVAGTWKETQQKHFADRGVFDQLYNPRS
jgi:sulfate transport system substrate-binding protein